MRKAVMAGMWLAAGLAFASPAAAAEDCEARIDRLNESKAEGEERLAEKNEVIEVCDKQYRRDRRIDGLVNACMKYEEQPVVKQQFRADCQIAAYNYANAFYELKSGYRK
jgi:hypothetical protein